MRTLTQSALQTKRRLGSDRRIADNDAADLNSRPATIPSEPVLRDASRFHEFVPQDLSGMNRFDLSLHRTLPRACSKNWAAIAFTHPCSCSSPSPPALSGGRGWVRWVIPVYPHTPPVTPTTSPSHR